VAAGRDEVLEGTERLGPALALNEGAHAVANVIPDRPHSFERLTLWIFEWPVFTNGTGNERTLIATAHRHKHLRLLSDFRCQPRGCRVRQVDVDLVHRDNDFRVYLAPWISPR